MLKNQLGIGRNMFAGDKPTQVWARDVLPILVQCAHDRKTTKFSKLTKALGLPGGFHNLKMGDVFRHIGTTLAELEQEDYWEGEIPHITSIVLKANGQCTPNMCQALTGDSTEQPSREQLRTELEYSFKYKKWDAVLDALSLPNTREC